MLRIWQACLALIQVLAETYKEDPFYLIVMFGLGPLIDVKHQFELGEEMTIYGSKIKKYSFVFDNVIKLGKLLMQSPLFILSNSQVKETGFQLQSDNFKLERYFKTVIAERRQIMRGDV